MFVKKNVMNFVVIASLVERLLFITDNNKLIKSITIDIDAMVRGSWFLGVNEAIFYLYNLLLADSRRIRLILNHQHQHQ